MSIASDSVDRESHADLRMCAGWAAKSSENVVSAD
jgi:hypothetical protein